MIGAHLGTYLDSLINDGERRIANEIADCALHDEHDEHHGGEFKADCWFCYNEAKQYGIQWMFKSVPVRRVTDG